MTTDKTNATAVGGSALSEGLGPTRGLTRAAFERWYSDGGKWPQSVERNSSGEGYKYAGAASAWTAWKAAAAADLSLRVELLAVLARLCELNAAERPMAKVWGAAQALVDSHKAWTEQEACDLAEAEGSRSADYLRRAIKAEAEVALLRAALNGGNVIERLQFALQRLADAADSVGVKYFDTDWTSDEIQELQAATHAAKLALGPNPRISCAEGVSLIAR